MMQSTPAIEPSGALTVARLSTALSAGYLEEHRLLPLALEDGVLIVAHAGDPDPQALAELATHFAAPISLRAVEEEVLIEGVRESYGAAEQATAAGVIAGLGGTDAAPLDDEVFAHDLRELANQAPVIRIVNLLLAGAVAAEASDVHIESQGRGLRVRYRIDGMLQDAPPPPPHLRAAVVSRLKIMAELDIAERRLPQDGRVRLRIDGGEFDVRVSTLPALYGESVVMRLLGADGRSTALETLGMADDTLAGLLAFARRPHGVLLATGPTGSGKTTTLYALVERLRTGHEKIVSVEDPVEYELAGVTQVPVNTGAGLSFARALRSILRQDPDVLLVGEMRDPETAEICTQAALTGHLVLSTLHTNDAPSALPRLLDLGVADYLVTSTVEVVLAQRLVRRVCDHCARSAPPEAVTARAMALDGWGVEAVRRGTGCPMCRGTGYHGRTGIYELLLVDDDIRQELLRRRGAGPLRRIAAEKGMRPLRSDGWRQVAAGITTPEEVVRATQQQDAPTEQAQGRHPPRSSGFTLIELLVVVLVIGMLAALVAPNVFRSVGASKQVSTRSQIELLGAALDSYRLDNDVYPSTAQGLEALRREPLSAPRPRDWRGPYVRKEIPVDSWGQPYVYRSPGVANPWSYDLISWGRDGREGGEGEDADIRSWE
jgi:general secretion pathway protein E